MHRDSENIIKYQGGLEFHRLGTISVWCARVQRWQVDTDMSASREEKAAGSQATDGLHDTTYEHGRAHTRSLFERPWAELRSLLEKVLFATKSKAEELTCPWR